MKKYLEYYWENSWFFLALTVAIGIAVWLTLGVREHKYEELRTVLSILVGINVLVFFGNIVPYRKAYPKK